MTDTLPTALDEPWHGTTNGYSHKKCRCDLCKKAGSDDQKKRRKRLRNRPITGEEPWHGTFSGYNYRKCRCDQCKKVGLSELKRRREVRSRQITGAEDFHGTSKGYDFYGCRCTLCKKYRKIREISKKYNLAKNVVEELLTDPVCEACGKSGFYVKKWCFDHDHNCCSGQRTCGKCFRSVICEPCNFALGLTYDDPTILRNLANYLERYSA